MYTVGLLGLAAQAVGLGQHPGASEPAHPQLQPWRDHNLEDRALWLLCPVLLHNAPQVGIVTPPEGSRAEAAMLS